MPWIYDEKREEKVYKTSAYLVDELPAWSEIYYDFYLRMYFRDELDIKEMDPFWNIPRRLYVAGMMCNQFNKMLYEDNYMDQLMDQFENCESIGFVLDVAHTEINTVIQFELISSRFPIVYKCVRYYNSEFDNGPLAYYISDNINTFPQIINKEDRIPRINLNRLTSMENAYPLLVIKKKDSPHWIIENRLSAFVMGTLLRDVLEYFGGTQIGWKDKHGNIVTHGDKVDKFTLLQNDPAL